MELDEARFEEIGKAVLRPIKKRKGIYEGEGYRLYHQSALKMQQCADNSVTLTIANPPSWNTAQLGETFNEYLNHIEKVFKNVLRVTIEGGYCSIVVGTLIRNRKHYPTPMLITARMLKVGWEFYQDIIWKREDMTKYILIFRKASELLLSEAIEHHVWRIEPKEIVKRLTLKYSQKGDEVLDPFIGGGETVPVVLEHGRRCVGYDIEAEHLKSAQEKIEAVE